MVIGLIVIRVSVYSLFVNLCSGRERRIRFYKFGGLTREPDANQINGLSRNKRIERTLVNTINS